MATAKCILQGSSIANDSSSLRFFVSGLTKTDSSALKEAYFADGLPYVPLVGNGQGPIGSPHPFITGLFASSLTIDEMAGQFNAFATVGYTPLAANQNTGLANISISTRVTSVMTELDADGNPIIVFFNVDNDDVNAFPNDEQKKRAGIMKGGNANGEQGGEVEKQIPITTLRIERKETVSPLAKSVYYVGCVNNKTFARIQKHGWLCTAIEGSSDDGGKNYNTSYEFAFIRDGWNKIAAWQQPNGTRDARKNKPEFWNLNPPHILLDDGVLQMRLNGLTAVRVQGEQDFGNLNLPEIV